MGTELHSERVSFLNVGTKILLKDTMDQYLRSLGDYKTFYASTMSSALRAFQENPVHVLLTEVDLADGSAFRLIKSLGGADTTDDDLYIILALEQRNDELMSLASELEVHSVLVKPFSSSDIALQVEKYRAWRTVSKESWQSEIREANHAAREKQFRKAEEHLKEAIRSAPGNPFPIYRAGLYYLKKPDYAVAEMLLLKAIELKPDYTQAVSALGSLYLMRHELDKAEQCYERAHKLSPLNPDRLTEMVRLYLERGLDACRNSLQLDPSSIPARFALAKLMAVQKDYVGAIRELERVIPSLRDEAKTEAQTFAALSRKLGGLAK